MGDYHNLYLKSDILLLSDVFENLRKTCLKYCKLEPCMYFMSPGLSWDAMLKMADKIRIDDRHRYVSVSWKRNERWYFIYSQYLPTDGFKWMIEKEMEKIGKYT